MASYKKILLCYDGTREGRKALRCGADLALDLKAETHLLSVVDMRTSIAQSAGLLTDVACGRFEDAAREILQEGVDWLTERGVQAHGHFAFGHPIDEIANLAWATQQVGFDLQALQARDLRAEIAALREQLPPRPPRRRKPRLAAA